MQNARLDESQSEIKIAGRNINNLRYAYDTTLTAESKEELKSLLMRVKKWKGWLETPHYKNWLGERTGRGFLRCWLIVSCWSWLFHEHLLYGNSLNCTFEVIPWNMLLKLLKFNLAALRLRCCVWTFSSCGQQLPLAAVRAPHCSGFSRGEQAQSWGPRALLLPSVWNLPQPVAEPGYLHWQADS